MALRSSRLCLAASAVAGSSRRCVESFRDPDLRAGVLDRRDAHLAPGRRATRRCRACVPGFSEICGVRRSGGHIVLRLLADLAADEGQYELLITMQQTWEHARTEGSTESQAATDR